MNEEELKQSENEKVHANMLPDEEDSGRDDDAQVVEDEEEPPERPDYEQELLNIVRSDLPVEVKREKLLDYHYNDLASMLEQATPEERKRIYKALDEEDISEIFTYLDDPSKYLEEMDVEDAADILENMDADDAIDVLENLDDEQKEAIFSRMDEESQNDINLIQSYDEQEIGSKMTTNYIAIKRGISVKQAMRSVVNQAAENDNLMTIYVLDNDDTFYGAITLQDLIIAREYMNLEELITTSYPYVYAHETVDECIEQLKDYSEDSIPVLDNDKHLLGVITSQDLVEVVDEQFGEDYAKLAGLTEQEDLKEPLIQSLKKRMPWLLVLMLLGLVVSSVVSIFEPVVAQLTVVVAFQSLILDMAGNVGTQSLAVTIRVLADPDLSGAQKFKFVLKEAKTGFTMGALLGLISLVFIGLYITLALKYQPLHAFAVSGCIGLAMLLAMTVSSITGTVIPMFFKKVGVDPAVASGPLITTLNDLVAVVTYYGMAWLLLINTMQIHI